VITMNNLSLLSLACASSLVLGCSGEKPAAAPTTTATAAATAPAVAPPVAPAPAPAPPAVDPAAEAETIFSTRCASCHGLTGAGDGMAAAALNPKPRAFGDKAWQASVDDNHLAKVIVEGGAAIGKSALMAANADLKDKPDVVKALIAKIRSYGK
jgi:mono/diheme cytochrome c family protein